MRAGLLTERLSIYQARETTSPSGYVEKEYVETHQIKAYRKKLSAVVGSGINASEEFIANSLVFQVRKYSFLNEDIHIKYMDRFYEVILLDLQRDKTYLITCRKANE